MHIKSVGLGIMLSATTMLAQNPPRPAFEVASIRPAPDGPPPQGTVGGVRIDGAQVRVSYLTLKDYIAAAYRVKLYQVSGPDWIGTSRFDVAATLPDSGLPSQLPEMIQTLLAERFQLKFHREQKDFPVYALEVDKGGLKMTEAPADPESENVDAKAPQAFTGGGSNQGISINLGRGSSLSFSNGKFEAKRLDMPTLAGTLERFLDRPVVDTTEHKGKYDISFEVTQEDYRAMLIRSAVVAGVILPPDVLRLVDGASSPSSLFDALQKLGLRLIARKAPLDVITVDNILKMPSEN
ncbi:MAG TPA: TIGR03435 family protein [Terriglobia bacterium]|jgi:uncharacterized protein (TIGR03435 family)